MRFPKLPFLFLFLLLLVCCRDRGPAYLDVSLSYEERVADLLSRMTLQQKIDQMKYDAPGIDSLGILPYNWWNECLHGVARSGKATVFPQAIGLAAAFDKDLMYRIGTAISDEARAKYNEYQRQGKYGIYQGLTFWSPNINIFRDPRWGRGMETYGEDPILTGSLAVQFILGLQGTDPRYLKTVATSKHFAVHSGPEPIRHVYDARVSDMDLYETYLPAFEMTVKEGNVQSVMCAYNRFRGDPCCGSSPLLQEILREKWGFNGYVVSDCWAIMDFYNQHRVVETPAEAAALAVRAGTDLNCGVTFPYLAEASKMGLIDTGSIETAVGRLFMARFRLGMFNPPEMIPYTSLGNDVIGSRKHHELALEAARKSIVLLKNKNSLLPLSKDLKTIAVIGPNADDPEVLLGNYNGIPEEAVTPLEGIIKRLPEAEVLFAQGCSLAEGLPSFSTIPPECLKADPEGNQPGLHASFFGNKDLDSLPVHERTDAFVDYNWWDAAPFEDLDPDNFSVRWTGYIVPENTGNYAIGAEGFNGYRLFLGDSLICQFNSRHESVKKYKAVELDAGKAYPMTLEFFNYHNYASIRLIWSFLDSDLEKEALDAAARADAVILFMGLSPRLEGEEMDVKVKGFAGGDRIDLELPESQKRLIRKICQMDKPTVLVLMSGSALAIGEEHENLPSILQAWYPGQAAGTAIADVLFGDINPSGRLPVTFYRSAGQLPPFDDYSMDGRTYRFFDGDPLYPFGFGLSYTRFEYNEIRLDKDTISPGGDIEVSVVVKNSGDRSGDEIVQLYLKWPEMTFRTPVVALKDYKRVYIESGQSKTVKFLITPEMMQVVAPAGMPIIPEGTCLVMAGGCLPAERSYELGAERALTASFTVKK